jgi:hypothetical protein
MEKGFSAQETLADLYKEKMPSMQGSCYQKIHWKNHATKFFLRELPDTLRMKTSSDD